MVMLRKWVLRKELPLIGILALCIFGIWIAAWRGTLTHLGTLRAEDALSLFQDRLQEEIRRVEAAGHAAESITLGNPLDEGHSGGLEAVLPFLDHSGALTNLVLWRNDGHSATILRTDQGWDLFLVHSGKPNRLFALRGSERVSVDVSAPLERTYIPQERPWFTFGARRQSAAWMPQRYTFWGSGIEGLSYVVPIRSKTGDLLGMVAADLQLNVLESFVKAFPAPEALRFVGRFSDGSPLFSLQSAPMDPGPEHPSFGHGLLHLLRPDRIPIAAERQGTLAGQRVSLRLETTTGALLPKVHVLFWASLLATEFLFVGFAWSMSRLQQGLLRPLLSLLGGGRQAFLLAEAPGKVDRTPEEFSDVWEISQLAKRILSAERIASDQDHLMRQFERIQRVESVGELAAGYVHDANNQLTLALCQLGLCQDAAAQGAEGLEGLLKKTEATLTTCAKQLQQILAFSRRTPGDRRELDLNALCRTIGSMTAPALGKGIQLRFGLEPDLPKVHGDPAQLEQALTNLLLNARDAMPEGGTIHIRTLDTPMGACIEVRDEGQGVPQEIHRQIFEPFFTTKGPEKGTGLGLFMVSSIMKAHGGRVDLVPEHPKGACFRLSFAHLETTPA